MSDSGSEHSRHRHRRRRSPYVAFYGQVGGNGFPAGNHYDLDHYRDYDGIPASYAPDDNRIRFNGRDVSHYALRSSWVVETMERLAAEITSCGYEPRGTSRSEKETTAPEDKRSEEDKELIDGMNTKLSKLEDAMKSVQDTLQTCLERLRRGQGCDGAGQGRRAGSWTPVWRQRRFDSPEQYRYHY